MKTIISKTAIALMLLLAPIVSNAHNIWIEVKGSGKLNEKVQVSLFYAEYAKGQFEKGAKLDKLKDIKVYLIDAAGNKTDIVMTQTETNWQGSFEPKTVGTYQVLGINDQVEVKDMSKKGHGFARTIMYLRATYTINGKVNQENPIHGLDVTSQKINNDYLLTVYKDKIKQDKINFTIINADGWVKTITSNEKGEGLFTPNRKGLYLVTLEWIDKTKGNFKDKEYETLIYKHTMSIIVE